jgi:predicted transposase/invertase (TIGR01784 family)
MLFVKHADLLKRLVCEPLGLSFDSIGEFVITNPEMPPETLSDKFCRLDINMTVDGQRVDLEIQVADEGDYPDRSLYYWARDFSTALGEGQEYSALPRTVVVSIVDFNLFDCEAYHSEFMALEVSRHTPLTEKMNLQYFELPKRPQGISAGNNQVLWLSLFGARTEEELREIEEMEVPIMNQAIGAYRDITATDEFKEVARLRSLARHNEASALASERAKTDAKWQKILEAERAENARLRALLGEN